MTKNNNFIEEVEKEFDEKFCSDTFPPCGELYLKNNATREQLKQFISKKLQEQKEEIIELARQYQEQIQGGGNGRRIFEQFISKIK